MVCRVGNGGKQLDKTSYDLAKLIEIMDIEMVGRKKEIERGL